MIPARRARAAVLRVDTSAKCKSHDHAFHQTRLHHAQRLGELSGRSRNTLLLRMRDDELLADATLDVGGTPQPLFLAQRVAELKRLPSRKAAPVVNPML
jgi:hypothetical protein